MDGARAENDRDARGASNARGEFAGRTVLVTGAGKGIGRASALLLVGRGAHVVALSRRRADLESLRAQTDCEMLAVDTAATHDAIASATPADFVVNCAGIVETQPFLDTSADAFDRTLAVNTRAAPMLARIPLQRFAQPDDVAEAIAWLLGDGARMVNGTTLTVDGGFRAG